MRGILGRLLHGRAWRIMRAVQIEEGWRASGRLPTIGEYLANRQVTIGAFPSMVILRLKPDVIAPGRPLSTGLTQLRWLVTRLIGVENDLLSAHKEAREGTNHTFFEVIKRAYDVDTERAILCALAIGAALREQHDQLVEAILHDRTDPPTPAGTPRSWPPGSTARRTTSCPPRATEWPTTLPAQLPG